MFRTLLLAAMLVLVAGNAHSQGVLRNTLIIEAVAAAGCSATDAVSQGQQVRLTGGGFVASESIMLNFACCDSTEVGLGTTTASGSGTIDTVVTVPTIPGTVQLPVLGMFEAVSLIANGGGNYLNGTIALGPATTSDTDSDGIPDYCDNCPALSNPGQEDLDTDGLGDVCDVCIRDGSNDLDGDGLCSDVDPCHNDAGNDVDQDGVCADFDNCPAAANPFQEDTDQNGIGDACQTLPTCSDGVDNDRDGLTDFPEDTGCADATDTTETDLTKACDDGIDNDSDALADFNTDGTRDPGCGKYLIFALSENPECDNGIDDDLDGFVDWDGNLGLASADPECQGFGFGTSETVPEPHIGLSLGFGVSILAALARSSPRA